MVKHDKYWEHPKEHSIAKMKIVAKYFKAWAGVMKGRSGNRPITYLDLFSGRGRYDDGTAATPVKILSVAQELTELHSRIRIYFFDKRQDCYQSLLNSVESHPVTKALHHRPIVQKKEIRPESVSDLPIDECTFSFIDPYGYKDLSIGMLHSVLETWGSDCVFYLSVQGIRRNLNDDRQRGHFVSLLGEDGMSQLQGSVSKCRDSKDFCGILLKLLAKSVGTRHNAYMLPFVMEFEANRAVSHCLVFLTKHHRGFSIMKDIMAPFSHVDKNGFPTFVYTKEPQIELFCGALEDTANRMCEDFRQQTLLVENLVDQCHRKRYRYPTSNLKQAVLWLEEMGKVIVDIPASDRPKRGGAITLGDRREVKFSC